jgi:hypothetical protein
MKVTPKPLDEQTKNPLVKVAPKARKAALDTLPTKERKDILDNLVESAMIMGVHDPYEIKQWLGDTKMNTTSVKAARDRVMKRWKKETADVATYANKERARLIKSSWDNVRQCEQKAKNSKDDHEWVKLKSLQLQWLQFISKLSFVEKMVEAAEAPTNVMIFGGKTPVDNNTKK